MCRSLLVPPKTLCRVFSVLSVLLALLSIYYWQILLSFGDKVRSASDWDSVLYLNDNNLKETISEKCGPNHLKEVRPRKFGCEFINAVALFMVAAILFCLQGFVQFFMTCADPITARFICLGIILSDLLSIGVLFLGVYLLQSPDLCLLEHTDILFYPGQQTILTFGISIIVGLVKPAEIISLILFICEQNLLISSGETRSKGTRRSEAFITPMNSRVNSFLGGLRRGPAGGGDEGGNGNQRAANRRAKYHHLKAKLHLHVTQMNSDEEEDENFNETLMGQVERKVSFTMDNEIEGEGAGGGRFVVIDLNEEQERVQDEMEVVNRNEADRCSVIEGPSPKKTEKASEEESRNEEDRNNPSLEVDENNDEKQKLLN